MSIGPSIESPSRWIAPVEPHPDARHRLICFPYAGGGAWVFRQWGALVPEFEVCAVELPGRGRRMRERAESDMTAMVALLAREVERLTDMPFSFFGHSMGALIAFELVRELRRNGAAEPVHLFVSGREAPQTPSSGLRRHDLPDEQLKAVLRDLNGTPSEVLENVELMQLMLPVLRADFALTERYSYRPEAALGCPITAYGGSRDESVPERALDGWRDQTTQRFTRQMFEGDHFFLRQATGPMLRAMTYALREQTG